MFLLWKCIEEYFFVRRSRYSSNSSAVDTSASLSAEESLPPTPASSVPVTPIVETPNSSTPLGFRFPKTKKVGFIYK